MFTMPHMRAHIDDSQLTNNNTDGNNVAIFHFCPVTHSACTVIVKAHHFLDYVLRSDKMCHNHEIRVNGRKGTSSISPSKPQYTPRKCTSL